MPQKNKSASKQLKFESLEQRIALAAAGLVDVGSQPEGALSGKVVYTSGGHGIMAANNGNGSWSFQRPLLLSMIEDLGNQDQMTMFAEYAFRAGATVVPMRPVGHQPNEIILDNDDTEVTFSGAWSNSSSSIYFGDVGDVPYKFATASATETATATYRPNVTEAGFYPVYAWTRAGTDRADDQLYKINHSGGTSEVTIDHRMVGTGLIYLGTYYFEQGTSGSVVISNRSSEPGQVVIADMIRFGNGVGDMDRGGGVSGRDRSDEGSIYWIQWHAEHSQGIPVSSYRSSATNDDGTANVGAPIRQAAYMNQAGEGSLSDRVYVSFHTNAGSGTSRGVLGLYNGNNTPASETPNQFLLANLLGREVNDDLVDQNGLFEHDFEDSNVVTLDRSDIEFGEINNTIILNEFDATIVEVAYHDNQLDAELLRDPKFRDAAARATLQGVVRYFNSLDVSTPLVMAPGEATNVSAESNGVGQVTVSWLGPVANSYVGDAPTGYMIYGSTNGYGFDGGTYVPGGAATSYTFTGLDPSEGAYYFKVVPVNAGGAAPDSEVVAAMPNAGSKGVLIVNGFDRLTRQQNPVQAGAERVRPRQSNSFDYTVQVAAAIEAASPGLVVDSTSNEALLSGAIDLSDYQAVIWISGEESTDDETFSTAEQTLVASYLAGGGKLLVSGSEIGWDLDRSSGPTASDRTFYNSSLRADYVSDDAGTYNVQGAVGSIFAGLSFSFDDGSQFYDVNFPDRINPLNGSTTALSYVGGSGGGAGIQYDGGATKVVNLAFPFETITSAANRAAVMDRVLDFFGVVSQPPTGDFDQDGDVDGRDFLAWQRGAGVASPTLADGDANGDGVVNSVDLGIWQDQYATPGPVVAVSALSAESEPVVALSSNDSPSDLSGVVSHVVGLNSPLAPANSANFENDETHSAFFDQERESWDLQGFWQSRRSTELFGLARKALTDVDTVLEAWRHDSQHDFELTSDLLPLEISEAANDGA